MKPKRKLKKEVKTAVLLLPIVVIIIWQLFFIVNNIKDLKKEILDLKETKCLICIYDTNQWSCFYE